MKAAVWLVRLGYVVLGLAGLLFLGITDFLPVDLWLWFDELWSGQSRPTYVRIVPGPESRMLEWVLLAVGIAAVGFGSMLKSRRK